MLACGYCSGLTNEVVNDLHSGRLESEKRKEEMFLQVKGKCSGP